MNTKSLVLALTISAAMVGASVAAGYIPIGRPHYTPTPDTVTPQAPTITPQADTVNEDTTYSSPREYDATPSDSCPLISTMNGKMIKQTNVNADCVPYSLAPTHGSKTIVTVTPNPDLVTPNPDIVTHNPPSCSQFGWSHSGGFGNYSC